MPGIFAKHTWTTLHKGCTNRAVAQSDLLWPVFVDFDHNYATLKNLTSKDVVLTTFCLYLPNFSCIIALKLDMEYHDIIQLRYLVESEWNQSESEWVGAQFST